MHLSSSYQTMFFHQVLSTTCACQAPTIQKVGLIGDRQNTRLGGPAALAPVSFPLRASLQIAPCRRHRRSIHADCAVPPRRSAATPSSSRRSQRGASARRLGPEFVGKLITEIPPKIFPPLLICGRSDAGCLQVEYCSLLCGIFLAVEN